MPRILALLLLAVAIGCEAASAPSSDRAANVTSPPQSAAPTSPRAAKTETNVSLEVASWEQIEAAITKHQGQVVVVDLWSTSCVPCLRELPKLAELQRQHPKTVACISVSLDYTGAVNQPPESNREAVMKILASRKMTVQNFLSSTSDFDVYDKIKLASIPAVLVYGRDGTLRKRFDNDLNEYGEEGFTYAGQIDPLVEELLAE